MFEYAQHHKASELERERDLLLQQVCVFHLSFGNTFIIFLWYRHIESFIMKKGDAYITLIR